ncbi:MAG TPA: penicillin-binding transpeptidase domain-containing protein, partial [Polyangiaceae bacterium]|nr:penicillin-binding transpeptidase domain-containing protein [Polyangiaceae bacterium]
MSNLLVQRSDVGEFRKRYKWMALFVTLALLTVVARLFQLQILTGTEYSAIAHENIIRRVVLPTTRGVIRDANGKVLASSRPSYAVEIVPGRVMPSVRPTRYRNGQVVPHDPDSWPRLADILRLNPEERRAFEARIRAACVSDEDKSPCWKTPIMVREDVPRDIVAELKQHTDDLAGVDVVSMPVRFYPYRALGAHMLGYVAEIDADALAKYRPHGYEDLPRDDQQRLNPLGYEGGDTVGATGIERAWESYLRGQRGWEKRVVDARGRYRTGPEAERLVDAPASLDPIPGRDLRLSIDVELEQAIEKAMRPHAAGAVVAVDVRTGRLLALYSKPDYDDNDVSGGAGRARVRETFNRLYGDALRPMVDKTMSGAFQPGSTMKPFTALAALEDRVVDPDHTERCEGFVNFGRRIFRCSHVHGLV